MMSFKKICYLLVALSFVCPLIGRNIILEFKGAYFLPTKCPFKEIFKGGALYGPQLTVQLWENNGWESWLEGWHLFTSLDYYRKHGFTIGLCEPTQIKLILLALGVEYLYPVWNNRITIYAALGLEPANARTETCSGTDLITQSQWGIGGIAKVGAYFNLPRNFVFNLFIDYSFVKVGSDDCECPGGVQFIKSNVSGAIFGAGLGYNF